MVDSRCFRDSLVYSSLREAPAAVQPDVDDTPAEVLVPGDHVHSVAQFWQTQEGSITQYFHF